MKKSLLIILAIIAGAFILGNFNTITQIWDATKTGATVPLVLACVIMVFRHLVQAVSYKAAFEAVDFSGPRLWDYVVLIFSLVFINTFCLFSGATGVAFIIDDAYRKGADLGKATSGAVLSQIGYFAAVFVISIIGFTTMIISGNVNWVFVTGAVLLAGTLIAMSSMYLVGYFRPAWLYALFNFVARPVGAIARAIRRPLKDNWGNATAESFISAARVMAQSPGGTATSVAWASFSALLNMMCLVAIGYAFGFENVAALIAAFALAAISVVLSPTPQGIGVVEAAIAAVLTANGCSLATATAIALVYRGIMFWMPFVIGALLLSQSGFFKGKKDSTNEQKDKDVAWISGTLLAIVGLVNIGLNIIPAFFAPYSQMVEWVDFHELFAGPSILLFGILCLVLAFGLIKRYRIIWAFATASLVLAAGVEFLFYQTIPVGIASLALAAWLMWKQAAFSQSIMDPNTRLGRGVLAFLGDDAPGGSSEQAAAQARLADSVAVATTIVKDERRSAMDIASGIEDIERGKLEKRDPSEVGWGLEDAAPVADDEVVSEDAAGATALEDANQVAPDREEAVSDHKVRVAKHAAPRQDSSDASDVLAEVDEPARSIEEIARVFEQLPLDDGAEDGLVVRDDDAAVEPDGSGELDEADGSGELNEAGDTHELETPESAFDSAATHVLDPSDAPDDVGEPDDSGDPA